MAKNKKDGSFWLWVTASVIFRLVLIYFPKNLNLASRPEVSTPLTSLRRRTLSLLLWSFIPWLCCIFYALIYILVFLFFRSGWRLLAEAVISVSLCRFFSTNFVFLGEELCWTLLIMILMLPLIFIITIIGFWVLRNIGSCLFDRIYVSRFSFATCCSWATHNQ